MTDTKEKAPNRATLSELLVGKRILLVVGSGGVGKTTTAATLGLLAALRGRRVLVLTIDPARRLADALGVSALRHECQEVPPERLSIVASERGETPVPGGLLHAMMLDQKRAFDDLVEKHAKDPAMLDRVLRNQIYQQISSALAGSHEYAAMSRLYELSQTDRYDLIVMDTPPTENAIDFLEAPEKVKKAVDSETIQWIMKPVLQQAGSLSWRLLGVGGAIVLRGLSRFVGSAFLTQVAEFFVEFQQVLGGFKERAQKVTALLHKDDVSFVLTCSPESLSIDEALYFHERLLRYGLPFAGCVVNRVHRELPEEPKNLLALLSARPELAGFGEDDLRELARALGLTYAEQRVLSQADATSILRLSQKVGPPLCEIPLLEEDVHDGRSLAHISRYVVPPKA